MKFIFKIISVIVLVVSCRSDYSGVPNVSVNVYINTFDPKYQKLGALGGWAYVDGGSKGIVVFQYDLDKYAAYDRHCTYLPESACSKVAVDQTNLYVNDTCCNSSFQLLDGSVSNGPATVPLRAYNTSFDGNIIHIWN